MDISHKICFKCGVDKPISEYYVHNQMADGHLNKCKECAKVDSNKRRHDNIDYVKEYDRVRGRTDKHRKMVRKTAERVLKTKCGKDSVRNSKRKWYNNNTEKKRAHTMIRRAVLSGKVIKPTYCQSCGDGGRISGHHYDYNKPLDVVWVCALCHGKITPKTKTT